MTCVSRLVLALILFAGGGLSTLGQAPADSRPSTSDRKKQAAAMMEKMSTPTEAHKALGCLVGEFDQVSQIRMGPGDTIEARAIGTGRWIMGGRFVEMRSASAPGEELKGERLLIYGYDPTSKKYSLVNVDSAHLSPTIAQGIYEPGTKTFTFEGTLDSPRGKLPYQWILTIRDQGVMDQRILVKAQGNEFVEVVTVKHTPRGK